MGWYYEDFQVGQEILTASRTITESDVVMFAGLSGDFNPLHTDEEFCRQTPYGTRIAHGMLVMSIASGLSVRTGLFDGTNLAHLGFDEWRFTGPVRFGDTIHCKMTVLEVRETSKPDRGVIKRKVEVFNQRGELVQWGINASLMLRRPKDK